MRFNVVLSGLAITLILLSITILLRDLSLPLSSLDKQIFVQLRIPMVLTAIGVGAALAVSSAILQVLLRNPLADPGIIGISSGASLFAALYLIAGPALGLSLAYYPLPLWCFIGAILSTLLIYLVARQLSEFNGSAVILAGIAVSTVAGAIIAWLYFIADGQSLRNLTFWLMGSLLQADLTLILLCFPAIVLLLIYAVVQAKNLNWLYLGQQSAVLKGLDVKTFNRKMILICALLVGLAVSLAGSIAFVGLLVPHFLRQLLGHDNRKIIPAAAVSGALLMVTVLLISGLFGGIAVPVSMLTATLGGPLFLYVLLKHNRLSL
ncbi:FecCD family ABC transporter permease [Neptunicella marina]|uniref:Iron ABC transporter permease n=1 Tax=Neptunicella marina TaxID=2125989 RepID=A0A8J6LZU2_9ALTE|nr:iron ABC transporter permease [Neptunicella marina]MBC3764302.1 iron ABC transporter permease [Neptunicella marina]